MYVYIGIMPTKHKMYAHNNILCMPTKHACIGFMPTKTEFVPTKHTELHCNLQNVCPQ